DGVDSKSGLPVVSLYGKSKEPQAKDLEDIDVILFDIQDVGVRFYTYISSLHYIMQAAAKHGKEVIVLDRPNPNGHLVDGPILDNRHKSFVGMHPVPVLHGLSIGEYGLMINGEKWLDNAAICSLTVVPCKNYRRTKEYKLPVKPSPNLPNQQSIYLYPHLCFFEGTHVSVGRGTDFPFQVFGAPFFSDTLFSFTPKSTSGASNPPYLNQTCYGKDLRNFPARELDGLSLEWLIWAYEQRGNKKEFFNSFFRLLAGGTELQEQIEQGLSEEEIKNSWKAGLADFNEKRKKYLLYPN
ncbi:MAG: exo-beta-N-acetylmuramidase NamZ family protein, partial [Luteibaculum sp.]